MSVGGFGSGPQHGGKTFTDDCLQIDVRRLAREELLKPGSAIAWQWMRAGECVATVDMHAEAGCLRLDYRYRIGEAWHDATCPVPLDWTACRYGGARAWFRCPSCTRRVALLYIVRGLFACRHCHRLAYRCQREGAEDRAIRRAERIRARLQWQLGILNSEGWKPPGMRWRTFDRLRREHAALVARAMASMAARLRLGRE
ncbi:hypothetical protein [Dokdonella sp.]|uniref:hypothetical protein n=1 Tax=Dokdonella sp. TaxID=2291710 RepID=UPI0027B887E8|nr:hypothetical protein [Dokdonella sp.]